MPTKIDAIIDEYKNLHLGQVIDYDKMRLYSIVENSTALEGSTLTAIETQLLLDEGITAKGKPMIHHQMVIDNYKALLYTIDLARSHTPITPTILQAINGVNMKNTGEVVNSVLGTVDGTRGEFRKVQAFSQALGYYFAPQKIPAAVATFCQETQQRMSKVLSNSEALELSFERQARLIIIHPWQDGNKRTSRLLSNYIQEYYGLPLGKVLKEDSAEYLQHLKDYKDNSNLQPFMKFMTTRYMDILKKEIIDYKKSIQDDLPTKKRGIRR